MSPYNRGQKTQYDIAIVGGGIHGIGFAYEAVRRGHSCILIESQDIAAGASSLPLNIFSGDPRNLATFNIAELQDNLRATRDLMREFPLLFLRQNIQVLQGGSYSKTAVNTGLRLYRLLQNRILKESEVWRSQSATQKNNSSCEDSAKAKLFSQYCESCAPSYRILLETAKRASRLGADILTRTKVEKVEREKQRWQIFLDKAEGNRTDEPIHIECRALINCCGEGANDFLEKTLGSKSRCRASVQSACYLLIESDDSQSASVLPMASGDLLYTLNFDEKHCLVGPIFMPVAEETVDKVSDEQIGQQESSSEEAQLVAATIGIWNQFHSKKISPANVVQTLWKSLSRVEDPACHKGKTFRNSILDLNNPGSLAPALSLFGIDIVKHRKIAIQGLDILNPFLKPALGLIPGFKVLQDNFPSGNNSESDNQGQPEIGANSALDLVTLGKRFSFLPENLFTRLMTHYGASCRELLMGISDLHGMGKHFGHGLYECEVKYLIGNEWAKSAEDILWRRTSLGLSFSADQAADLATWLDQYAEIEGQDDSETRAQTNRGKYKNE